jgi:hypothetical protein
VSKRKSPALDRLELREKMKCIELDIIGHEKAIIHASIVFHQETARHESEIVSLRGELSQLKDKGKP